jgi:hypothetical protein
MLEVTEMILASINAQPGIKQGEIYELPYLKTISDYGISFSISELLRRDLIKDTFYGKPGLHGSTAFKYSATKKGKKYLEEHGYLD